MNFAKILFYDFPDKDLWWLVHFNRVRSFQLSDQIPYIQSNNSESLDFWKVKILTYILLIIRVSLGMYLNCYCKSVYLCNRLVFSSLLHVQKLIANVEYMIHYLEECTLELLGAMFHSIDTYYYSNQAKDYQLRCTQVCSETVGWCTQRILHYKILCRGWRIKLRRSHCPQLDVNRVLKKSV